MKDPRPLRPRYFQGEFLSTADFRAAQRWVDGLRCAHDGALHTWGIAQGLEVEWDGADKVTVSPGVAVASSGELIVLTEARRVPIPSVLPSFLRLASAEQPVEPVRSGWLKRTRIVAVLEWTATEDPQSLILAKLMPGPEVDASLRRYAGMEVGSVEFMSPAPPASGAPALYGWSAAGQRGLRVSADLLRMEPRTVSAAAVSVTGGRVAVGSLDPRATFDLRAPNAPLAGQGRLTSQGSVVWCTDGSLAEQISPGDWLLSRTRAGEEVQAQVVRLLPGDRAETSVPMEVEDAPFERIRWRVARLASADRRALWVVDRAGALQLGQEQPDNAARLRVAGGDLRFDGEGRQIGFAADGSVRAHPGQSLTFSQKDRTLTLRDPGTIRFVAGVTAENEPAGVCLQPNGNVGVGTRSPDNPLTVEGAIYASGGFVFPDGTVQTTAEIPVPIGTVIDWWRPNADIQVPDAWQICDGRTVTDPASPLNGVQLPDLGDRFILGAADAASMGPVGSDSHHHTYAVGSHTHTFIHAHPDYSGTSGGGNDGEGDKDNAASQFSDKGHRHQFQATIPPSSTSETGVNSDSGQTALTSSASLLPPYIGLLKLMRIR
ncbi:MAG: hypothetical protein IRZ16_20035 [Myxococcaceae bacterium]|nr:hypothetical protein [Myxococcaceae bacterium]